MPAVRARDHGIVIGRVPTGPANAITDVPGVAVGHASHSPDNTGVTVILPRADSDTWLEPVYAGVAVLNGAGELTGSIQIREWGVMETPVFLTATPYVGAVYQAATRCSVSASPGIGVDDVIIPVVGECDSSGVVDVVRGPVPDATLIAAALDAAGTGAVGEGQVGAGIGMHCSDFAGGIGTSSRTTGGYTVGVLLLVNFGDWEELRIAGRLANVEAPNRGVDGSCIAVVATDAPLLPVASSDSRGGRSSASRGPAPTPRTARGRSRSRSRRPTPTAHVAGHPTWCGPRCCAPRRCTRCCSPPRSRRRRRRSSTRCSGRTRWSGRAARRTRSRSTACRPRRA